MKFHNPLLNLLSLTAILIPDVSAHKDKKKAAAELEKDMTAHTLEAKAVNYMVFVEPLWHFMDMWHNHEASYGVTGLDWVTDACTGVDDRPFKWDFKPACIRHDFAYRNFKRQGRLGHQARKKIDKNFKEDMYDQCRKEKHKHLCRIGAKIYYAGVRVMGRRDLVEPEKTMMHVTGIANATTEDTAAIAAITVDSNAEITAEERAQKVFEAWIAELRAHPEVLMEMTERDLENVEVALDEGINDIEKGDEVQEEMAAVGL
ncbi:uncharacterized protein J4E79_010169 [Alternaria viburni]|uniref:uncharacterized protein n=1 Tax=Alternaria viburni TaxID=566460 RepID=UPI0020C28067|nr:uncharacterized protein J4E79_010169 [Alternaria viburni]KAI4647311.1 hypothetical protein J4E79_010169 [Alternaria viburni]